MPKYLNDTGVGQLKEVIDASVGVSLSPINDSIATIESDIDSIESDYVRSFDSVAEMQAATDLQSGMTCHTNGFHSAGDGGAAYYTVGTTGTANGMDVLALQGGLVATLVVTEPYVTPEQFGAYGDGTHDDTAAFKRCVAVCDCFSAPNSYALTEKITFSKSHAIININIIVSSASDYAVSIGNGAFGTQLSVNYINASNGGAIVETTAISGRWTVYIGTIAAANGIAFYVAGGTGGLLDSSFSGEVWEGSEGGLKVMPTASFVGNLKFNGARFTATSNDKWMVVVDTTNGTVTQLLFDNCSVEPISSNTAASGILLNVVKKLELVRGYFRVSELTGKTGKILKIAGTITSNIIPETLDFQFDMITLSRIDVSEVMASRYYTWLNPIARIRSGQIQWASEPQTSELIVFGNRICFRPNKVLAAVASGTEYTWDATKAPSSYFELTADTTINIPSWLLAGEEIVVKTSTHTATMKFTDVDESSTTKTISGNQVYKVGVYRTGSNVPYIYAVPIS